MASINWRGHFGGITKGVEAAAHTTARNRKELLIEIEALRERTWRNKSIKTFSPEWHVVCAQLRAMRKALKRMHR